MMNLCYTELKSIVRYIDGWDLDKMKPVDKLGMLDLQARATRLMGEISSITTPDLLKVKRSEVKKYKHKVKEIYKEWSEMKELYFFVGEDSHDDYFEILGIKPTSDWHEIRRAYRIKAKETHPDNHGGDDREFLKVQNAYEHLKTIYGG